MRILWLTIDRSNRIAHHFDDFRIAVSELPEVEVITLKKPSFSRGASIWKQSREMISGELEMKNIVADYLSNNEADFIFCDAFFAYVHEDWENIDIPTAIFIEDVHNEVPKAQVDIAKQKGISTIFHRFNFPFHEYHPTARFDFNCFWLPHSIRMQRYNDYFSKSTQVLHVGVYLEGYPFRKFVVDTLSNKPYFTLIKRPQDVRGESREGKWPIDRDYDNLLQKSEITITGGSKYNAPVQKYFEIPAANSLLMSNWFPDLGLLGFIPETNMVIYNKENLVEKVEALLEDKNKIKRISNNGYNLILLKHTSEIRSKQFVDSICTLLNTQQIYNIEPCTHQVNFKPETQANVMSKPEQKQKAEKLPNGNDWRSRIRRANDMKSKLKKEQRNVGY